MKKDSGLRALLRRLLTRELILYVVFGLLTTAVSIVTFHLCEALVHYTVANIISWVLAVSFAYVTNRIFVFRSENRGARLVKEIALFFAARLFSLAVEEGGLVLLIDLLHMDSLIAKLILQVVVVVLNYILSKLVIFKKKK